MARKQRETSGTGIYHVMLRGVNRQDIFEDEEDYRFFRKILYQMIYPVSDVTGMPMMPRCAFYAYCLMPNHVHLLVRQTSDSLAAVVKRIAVTYAMYYNKRYERYGHLFQDRFLSQPVNDGEYFFTLLQYIHQNPVAAGMTTTVSEYPWSSWGEYERHGSGLPEICSTTHVLHRMSFDDLHALVNTLLTKTEAFLDVDSGAFQRTDDEVRAFLTDNFGLRTPEDLQVYDKVRRRDILAQAKAFGASLRQLARMTGLSIGIVRGA